MLLILPARVFADSIVSENSLKAAFIFHFISFTDWNDDSPNYSVCIPDDSALREETKEALKDKVIKNRSIVVSDKTSGCHILVSNGPASTGSTLTIGELNKGALFEFRLIDNKMKFAVDLARVKRSTLKISSQLLKLAILEDES
jgi:hypothetical protein